MFLWRNYIWFSLFYQKKKRKTIDEKQINSLKADAADDVENFKTTSKDSAKAEGTDYDTYLENALAAKGVETTEELEALRDKLAGREVKLEGKVLDRFNEKLATGKQL